MEENEKVVVVACESAGIKRVICLTSWKIDHAEIGLINDHSAICGECSSVYKYTIKE